MCCFVGSLPNWIQAGSAICLVVLTGLTLRVLRGYAEDTKRLANDSASQAERSQMPFLVVVTKTNPGVGVHDNWYLENHGFGPAINISRSRHFPDRESGTQDETPLAPREEGRHIDSSTAREMLQKGFIANYESLSGEKYNTSIEWLSGKMQTSFFKPTKTRGFIANQKG